MWPSDSIVLDTEEEMALLMRQQVDLPDDNAKRRIVDSEIRIPAGELNYLSHLAQKRDAHEMSRRHD